MRILGLLIVGVLAIASTGAQAHGPNSGGGAGRCQVPGPNHQIRVVRVRSAQECYARQRQEAQRFRRHRQARQYQNGHNSRNYRQPRRSNELPLGAIIGGVVGVVIGHQFDH